VDVLVRSRPGKRLTLDMLSGLKQELESHFARRVDVLADGSVIEELRPLIERDKVKLYGWTHKKRVPSETGKGLRPAGH
jgi:predicted nucleotidyltransferase